MREAAPIRYVCLDFFPFWEITNTLFSLFLVGITKRKFIPHIAENRVVALDYYYTIYEKDGCNSQDIGFQTYTRYLCDCRSTMNITIDIFWRSTTRTPTTAVCFPLNGWFEHSHRQAHRRDRDLLPVVQREGRSFRLQLLLWAWDWNWRVCRFWVFFSFLCLQFLSDLNCTVSRRYSAMLPIRQVGEIDNIKIKFLGIRCWSLIDS